MAKKRVVLWSGNSGRGYSGGEAALVLAIGASIFTGIGYGADTIKKWWKKRK